MYQLGVIRLAVNLGVGLLSNIRTILWLALMVTIVGYGYLVVANDWNIAAAFQDITGYGSGVWSWTENTFHSAKSLLMGVH